MSTDLHAAALFCTWKNCSDEDHENGNGAHANHSHRSIFDMILTSLALSTYTVLFIKQYSTVCGDSQISDYQGRGVGPINPKP